MMIAHIDGATRICGKAQGYLGLPVRDELIDDTVNGEGTPAMVTAWQPTPEELEALNRGASVHVRILGTTPPPMMVLVGPAPAIPEQDPHLSAVSLELKPCPFCGGEAGYYASGEAVFKMNWIGHVCHCKSCQARVSTTAGSAAAAAMWNARALTSIHITDPAQSVSMTWPKALNVTRHADNSWHGDISFARFPTDEELKALHEFLRVNHAGSARPPAAPVHQEDACATAAKEYNAVHFPCSAGNGYDPAEFRKLQDIIDNQADQILDLHEVLKSAYALHEFIAGAYILSLADFRYLNVVSTKIKAALPGGDVTINEPQSVCCTFDADESYALFLILDTYARSRMGEDDTVNHLRERVLPFYRNWHAENPYRAHPSLTLPRPHQP